MRAAAYHSSLLLAPSKPQHSEGDSCGYRHGGITLSDIGGDTYAKTSFGSVLAERIGGNLTVENTNGSVHCAKRERRRNRQYFLCRRNAGIHRRAHHGGHQNGAISVMACVPPAAATIFAQNVFLVIRVRVPRESATTSRRGLLSGEYLPNCLSRQRHYGGRYSEWENWFRRLPASANGFERRH